MQPERVCYGYTGDDGVLREQIRGRLLRCSTMHAFHQPRNCSSRRADILGKIANREFGITVTVVGLEKVGFRKYYENI